MWEPVDTRFFSPRCPVAVVDVGGGDGESIRVLLEALNCVVIRHAIGTPSDFLEAVGQGRNAARYLVITGHASAKGIHFGKYGSPEVDVSQLHDGWLPAEAIRTHVELPGCMVIAVCCHGGSRAMAEAFLEGGAAAYTGFEAEVDGGARSCS